MANEQFKGFAYVGIQQFQLTSLTTNKTLDIRRLIDAVDYYSSIFDPTVVLVAHVSDLGGAVRNFPLAGDELVTVEITTPGRDALKKTFHVHHISDEEYDSNGMVTGFMMHAVSVDEVRARTNLVELGFNGTISQAVTDVMRSFVKTPLPLNIEETKGIEKLVIPSWDCWETIEFFRKRAVSQKYDTPYFFFEDSKGWNFCSLESLIEQKKRGEIVEVQAYPFNPGAGDGPGKITVRQSQYRNAENFHIINRVKLYNQINNGGIYNKTFKFDFNNKKVVEQTLKFTELDGKIKQPLDDKYNRQFGSMIEKNAKDVMIQYVVPHDSKNPSAFTDNVNIRQMINRHFDVCVGFTLYGDTQMQAGDVIKVNVPKSLHSKDDDALTGNYMIGSLKHTLVSNELYTHVEAHRFGMGSKVF